MRSFKAFLLLIVGSVGLLAQAPTVAAVVNAASNVLPGLPNAGIAQGAMFIVYGGNIGPAALVQVSSYPLPTTLSGTAVRVTVGGTTVNAIMVYTVSTQVAAILPSNTPVGTGTLSVTYNGATSGTIPITVVANGFGIFSVSQNGLGAGIITYADYSLVTASKAANPGEAVIVWGTGGGPVSGNEAAAPLPGDQRGWPLQVFVGGKSVTTSYQGRSGCCAGLDQLVFSVPSGVTGCNVPVVVRSGNIVSNTTTMAIAASGRTCTPTNSGVSGSVFSELSGRSNVAIGSVSLVRSTTITPGITVGGITVGGGTTTSDSGSGVFARYNTSAASVLNSTVDVVSLGACTVITFRGITANLFQVQSLDAGASLGVAGPAGSKSLNKLSAGGLSVYSATLGTGTPGNYLDAGRYSITGPGGADVGSFSTAVTVPGAFTWTNQESISAVTRGNGVTVNWNGGDPSGMMQITGTSLLIDAANPSNALGVTFTCVESMSAGTFTVPAYVLLALPVTQTQSVGGIQIGGQGGTLGLTATATPASFTATGIDLGQAQYSQSINKSVTYQ